jgi:hypothetical protein
MDEGYTAMVIEEIKDLITEIDKLDVSVHCEGSLILKDDQDSLLDILKVLSKKKINMEVLKVIWWV